MSNRSFTAAEISSKIALFHAFQQDGMRVHEITRRLVAAMPAVSAVKTSPLSPVPNRH